MFGNKNSTGASAGTKTLLGGIAMTVLQTLISRRIAGRAAGVAVRGGGGLPGLLAWMAVSYAINKYLNRDAPNRPAPPAR